MLLTLVEWAEISPPDFIDKSPRFHSTISHNLIVEQNENKITHEMFQIFTRGRGRFIRC